MAAAHATFRASSSSAFPLTAASAAAACESGEGERANESRLIAWGLRVGEESVGGEGHESKAVACAARLNPEQSWMLSSGSYANGECLMG